MLFIISYHIPVILMHGNIMHILMHENMEFPCMKIKLSSFIFSCPDFVMHETFCTSGAVKIVDNSLRFCSNSQARLTCMSGRVWVLEQM